MKCKKKDPYLFFDAKQLIQSVIFHLVKIYPSNKHNIPIPTKPFSFSYKMAVPNAIFLTSPLFSSNLNKWYGQISNDNEAVYI